MLKNILIAVFINAILLATNYTFAEENSTSTNTAITDNKSNEQLKTITLNEETVVNLALANNLDIKAEKLKFDNSVLKMATSWNIFVPTVSMSATLSRYNFDDKDDRTIYTSIPNPYSAFIDPLSGKIQFDSFSIKETVRPQWGLAANFNLNLNINAAMGFKVYQTVIDYQTGKINLENAKKKIVRDVKKSLYSLILLQKNIEIQNDSIATAEKRYNQAVINYKNGLISDYDRLSAEVAYVNLKPILLEMENNYKNALLLFKQMIGIKKDIDVLFDVKIESENKKLYNADELVKKYLNNNLDLKTLKNTMRTLVNVRNISIGLLTPTFTFMYSMDPTFQKDPMKDDWFGDNDYNKDNWKQRSGMFAFTVSLPVSSWVPFSKEQMDAVNAQYNASETMLSYEKLKQATELQIDATVLKLEKSINSIDSLKLNLELATKAYKKAEEAYRMGQKELLEVQNSELELKKAKLNLLNEEYNYTTGLLDLEYIINSKLE
jgi:outer membrane protein TolC